MKYVDKQLLRELHKPGWAGFWLALAYGLVFYALLVGIGWALAAERYSLVVLGVVMQAYLMHAYLLAIHEAAHGGLCPVGFINGYLGRAGGVHSFVSLSLFRAVHHYHHAYLGTVRDEEFWPFVDPKVPRWKRCIAAVLALTCGLFWTPFVLLRAFLRRESAIREPAVRRQIWLELIGMVLFWVAVVFAVVWVGVLPAFLVGFLLPAFIAGNIHTWRQFVEHIGLTGRHNLALTRSVRHRSRLGRLLAWSLFQEPLHDVHHTYPKVPQEAVPSLAAAEKPLPPELPVFGSYAAALCDALPSLADPKFGKEWDAKETTSTTPNPTHTLRDSA